MSRRLIRLSLLFAVLLTSEVWAIGLGNVKLDSALNEPLRAEINLLSASPDELSELTVSLASADTFSRYGIDRPIYLQGLEFKVVNSGSSGSLVQVRSRSPITEPFLTFLVEATWSSGRLLREYTVLLDPPTYAAPSIQQAPAVAAPSRSVPSDSGRIDRQPAPTPPPRQVSPPSPSYNSTDADTSDSDNPVQTHIESVPLDDSQNSPSGDVVVARGDTLWGLTSRHRTDNRLTMNQMMLAIYEANPGAFDGNINALKAGSSLRIPSAHDVFQINRDEALSEVQRQHGAWGGNGAVVAPEQSAPPSLVLVPPDEEPVGGDYSDEESAYEPPSREEEIEGRISDLEVANVPAQESLIAIRDSELAALRQELADIRGEVYEPPADLAIDDDAVDDVLVDESSEDQLANDVVDVVAEDIIDDKVDDESLTEDVVSDAGDETAPTDTQKSIVDTAIDFLLQWGIIIGAVLLVIGGLIFFIKRGDDDDDVERPWESLDADETQVGRISATSAMQAPVPEDAIVVVEQESGEHAALENTAEALAVEIDAAGAGAGADPGTDPGTFGSLEDTFSSETALNLDQTDPAAEADFHMAYGLYDQAADLINGALQTDPQDKGLMSKLCEIYFVWGNREAFVEAATRLKAALGGDDSANWDKIVIMGQQIAADHALFAGAQLTGVSEDVDLSFDDGSVNDTGALDMDLGGADSGASDIVDLGAAVDDSSEGIDFVFDAPEDDDAVDFDMSAVESTMTAATAEMPAAKEASASIEEDFDVFGEGTSELPSLDEESLQQAISGSAQDAAATAEINLDDLDLDVDGLAETEVASLDDLDITGQSEALFDTGVNEALGDLDLDLDLGGETGRNPEIDPQATGVQEALESGSGVDVEDIDFDDLDDALSTATGMRFAVDETGQNPVVTAESDGEPAEISVDQDLLEATGLTQVLSEDMSVETATDLAEGLSDSDETMLAQIDEDFDFASTEALPVDVFAGGSDSEATVESPTIAQTDVDLDLDNLTAALQVSEIGDTIEQFRDDATVEQPRPTLDEDTADVATIALTPDDMSGDLHDARTMTEVGTKLDLARAYVDMGDPAGARGILEEVLDEGDDAQKQQAKQLLDSLPS